MSVLRYAQRIPEPLVVADAASDDRFAGDPYFADVDRCSLLALPILSRARLRAVLLLENRLIRGAFTAERLDAVELIVGQLAVSLDNAQLYSEIAASRARIVAAADQARRRIERDLHDGAQQRLVALGFKVQMAADRVPAELDDLKTDFADLSSGSTAVLTELREISRGIHPAVLASGGLAAALKILARRSAVPVTLDVAIEADLPDSVEVAAYYVTAEALTNAAKHAQASEVTVSARTGDEKLYLSIRDDGIGGADFRKGSGIIGLKDRIDVLGGKISVESPVGSGTRIGVTIPLALPRKQFYEGR